MKTWFENKGKYRITIMIFGLVHLLGFFLLPHLTYSLPVLGGLYEAAGMTGTGIPRNITGFQLLLLQGITELEEISVFGYIQLIAVGMGVVFFLMHALGKGKASYIFTIVFGVLQQIIYVPGFILSLILAGASFGMFQIGIAGPILMAVSLAEFIVAIIGLVQLGKEEPSSEIRQVKKEKMNRAKEGLLIGTEGVWEGAQIPIRDGEIVYIGRDPGVCQIVLKDRNISRKHCAIQYDAKEGRYCVTDYSSNGVFDQDGRRLHKGSMDILHREDEIHFGMPVNAFRFGC